MDYIAPLNEPATEETPRPAYVDGDKSAGIEGSYPSGKSLEYPMREILAVIENAGLTPSNGDLTQLWQAIQIAVGGAGGDPATFVYNPVFPHVTVNGGIISISASNGQIIVADGETFIWRGGVQMTTGDFDLADRTFALVADTTYHVRWHYNGGSPELVCIDVMDGSYNPGALAETDKAFDSTYDDMLIARVVTDGSNDPTVTALKNLTRLSSSVSKNTAETGSAGWGSLPGLSGTLNWARTAIIASPRNFNAEVGPNEEAIVGVGVSHDRYAISGQAKGYVIGLGAGALSYVSGTLTVDLLA